MEDQTINLNSDDFGDESNEDDNNNKKKAKKKNANKRKRRPGGGIGNEKAECWKYFTPKMERPDGPEGELIKMAYCNFCPQVYRADSVKNGTKNMNLHYVICEFNPMNEESLKQKKLCHTKKDNNGDGGTLQNWKYDENTIKKSLIELIVLAELPFKFVEHPAFIKYSKSLQPKYNLPSRFTISRDVSKFYLEEKKILLKFLGNPNHTIHLTTVTHNSSDVQKSSTQSSNTTRRRGNTFLNSFKSQNSSRSSGVDDELKKYLKEPPLELDDEEEFDILSWWKMNSPRFPIVSKMAKDILSIQISTVASESAFSTSGRILDPYRNALSPQIVEALICTQSWVRTSQKSIYMDDLEDLVKDEEVIKEMKEVLDKLKEDNGKGISLD